MAILFSDLSFSEPPKITLLWWGTLTIIAIAILYQLSIYTYNLLLSPLRSYPGPIFSRISRIPFCYHLVSGTSHKYVFNLHKKYGPVVRIAPDELAFAHPDAWRDIMGHRPHGEEMAKPRKVYRPLASPRFSMPNNIIFSGREEHAGLRRQLAHGFSERSMRDQQPLIAGYIDLLIQRLHEHSDGGAAKLDMTQWYNFTTFDVIGDLAFGEPFGCLQTSDYHPWVRAISETVRVLGFLRASSYYPLFQNAILSLMPAGSLRKRDDHLRLTGEKVKKRIAMGENRPDLMEGLLQKKNDLGLGFEELKANAHTLIIAGSETTATLLSGVTYLLLMNPEVLQKATQEVREAFSCREEIDLLSVSKLTYMLACLNEAMRIYPPVPIALPRVVPKGGAVIVGHHVAEGTNVGIHHWAVYHDENYFKDPFAYHPERFLGDPRFANDRPEVVQPFHVGPRNCIGRNLAYAEMRLILASILFHFDMRIADESRDWTTQKVFTLWDKKPLMVHLIPVKR